MRSVKGSKFAMVPVKVMLDPSNAALRVWCGLCMFASHENICWPSQRALAEYLGVSQTMVHRGIEDLKTMKMVTVEDGPTGRRFFRLHMAGDSPMNQSDSPVKVGDSPVKVGDSPMNQNFNENLLQELESVGVAPETPPAIDSRTRLKNQTHESDSEAEAPASPGTTTATAGQSGFDDYWHALPRVLTTNRSAALVAWSELDTAARLAAIAAAPRYAAVVDAAPADRKQWFRHAAKFLLERAWEMSDDDWRIQARVPVAVEAEKPADFW